MIHSIKIDHDIDERLREFNAKLPADQRIISIETNEAYVFVHTETKSASKGRNLLLEDFNARITDKLQRG